MALNITSKKEPIKVESIIAVLYAPPGFGKTSIALTSKNPLLIDFDKGSHRAITRSDTVQVTTWKDVSSITPDDLSGYDTIVLDTAGRCLDILMWDIVSSNPKHGNSGGLSLKGYGVLKSRFSAFIKLLQSSGKDIVIVAHMDEKTDGEVTKERLDMTGSSKGEVYKMADMMGRISIENGDRFISFDPTEASFGKNPAQLPKCAVPLSSSDKFNNFFGDLIDFTKEKMNELTEEQRLLIEQQQAFTAELSEAKDKDAINLLIEKSKECGAVCKAALNTKAKALGLSYDRESKAYAEAA